MTTAATATATGSSKFHGSLYEQARKHVIKANTAPINELASEGGLSQSSRAIPQSKQESRGRGSRIAPSSARGISCKD